MDRLQVYPSSEPGLLGVRRPDQSFNQLLPVTSRDQEHEAGCPTPSVRTGTSKTRQPIVHAVGL